MTRHLLVTNDFPPKTGGIQNFLWELWRRLPSSEPLVYTTGYEGADVFDSKAPMRIVRSREPWLLPLPHVIRQVNQLALQHEAEIVIIDPVLPVGLIGAHLRLPYAIVAHGAEVVIPARLPGARALVKKVMASSSGVIAASAYCAEECKRVMRNPVPCHVILPSVDSNAIKPLDTSARAEIRANFGLDSDAPMVLSVSRLVPRKGMDMLVHAAVKLAKTHKNLQVVIVGEGREKQSLERLIKRLKAPVKLTGALTQKDVAKLYGCADIFAMLCQTRWAGLEQEGFGIVFLEAASAGVPQVAGNSGGAHEAVLHGKTGIVLERNTSQAAADAISALLSDHDRRRRMAEAARLRAVSDFSCDVLAMELRDSIQDLVVKANN